MAWKMKIMKRLWCAMVSHRYRVLRTFNPTNRQVGCPRCGTVWGMNDRARALVVWDGEFEELYRTMGLWPGKEARRWDNSSGY